MALPSFAAGIEIVSDDQVKRPATVKTTNHTPSNDELDAIELPDYGLTDLKSPGGSPKVSRIHSIDNGTPKTPGELEESQPSTPKGHEGADIVPTFSYPKMNQWRMLAACWEYLGNGLNDSAPGALIPYIEKWFEIGYAVVSTIWISNAGMSPTPHQTK